MLKATTMTERESYIIEFCLTTDSTNPVEIANELMDNDCIRIHGPEHHFLTAAALAAAYCNAEEMDAFDIREIFEKLRTRCSQIIPAHCGYYGVCGDVLAAGAVMSVLLKTTHLSKEEWTMTGRMAARCQNELALLSGPRCCKRTTITTLLAAVEYINEAMDVTLSSPDKIICKFKKFNDECHHYDCSFFSIVNLT